MHLIVAYRINLVLRSLLVDVFFVGLSPFDTKLVLQKHSASLDNHEQASVFEAAMVCEIF